MNSQAPKIIPLTSLTDIGDDSNESWETTTGVRKRVRTNFTDSDYPSRPERVANFEKVPIKRLEYDLEAQIDQWSAHRMLKTQIVLSPDNEKQDITENVLMDCKAKGKIHNFESILEDGKSTYNIYYRYR